MKCVHILDLYMNKSSLDWGASTNINIRWKSDISRLKNFLLISELRDFDLQREKTTS